MSPSPTKMIIFFPVLLTTELHACMETVMSTNIIYIICGVDLRAVTTEVMVGKLVLVADIYPISPLFSFLGFHTATTIS